MNLIEQLGWYEKAKSKLRDNGSLHAERLKKALLQYRRENNIFEKGDRVCFIENRHHSGILTVLEPVDCLNGILLTESETGVSYGYSSEKYRHASDEEIKTGKRDKLEFNAGDVVVFSKIKSEDNDLYVVSSVIDDGYYLVLDGHRGCVPYSKMVHATPQEIAQGYRDE